MFRGDGANVFNKPMTNAKSSWCNVNWLWGKVGRTKNTAAAWCSALPLSPLCLRKGPRNVSHSSTYIVIDSAFHFLPFLIPSFSLDTLNPAGVSHPSPSQGKGASLTFHLISRGGCSPSKPHRESHDSRETAGLLDTQPTGALWPIVRAAQQLCKQ